MARGTKRTLRKERGKCGMWRNVVTLTLWRVCDFTSLAVLDYLIHCDLFFSLPLVTGRYISTERKKECIGEKERILYFESEQKTWKKREIYIISSA